MKIIFAGTPEFARLALERIHTAGLEVGMEVGMEVVLVLTQPDRPAGRGMQLQASSVKQYALAHQLPLAQPHSLRLDGRFAEDAAAAQQAIAAADADVMVVAAYGLLLPQWLLDAMQTARAHGRARLGCLNIHASLLPRWRGAAPIQRAIAAGDAETGITIMQMDAGLDTGALLLRQSLPIAAADTSASLHDRLAALGANMVVQALQQVPTGTLHATPQPADGVCYAHKINKHEAAIHWHSAAAAICRRVRAFNPFPGASTQLQGETIKVWRAEVASHRPIAPAGQLPGTVLALDAEGIAVQAADGVVLLQELQRPGGKRLAAEAFLRGFALAPGVRMGMEIDSEAGPGHQGAAQKGAVHAPENK
ncbi:MAG: methionyl-tRNA formyltransferase [Rhodoferax sp.]|nr:methionyl-tRNA formyltransferase [Rhodoferax sp.]